MMKQNIALITATIAPSVDMTHLALRDPQRRLSEYEQALSLLLKQNAFDRVIFVENSGFLGSSAAHGFHDLFASRVEFLSVEPDPTISQRGKGLSEALMIRKVMERSHVESGSLITKISGRYILSNGNKYISAINEMSAKVYCVMWRNLSYADTRVFTFAPCFFRDYFNANINVIDDEAGFFIEHCLAKSVHEMLFREAGGWALPRVRAHLRGASASTGRRGSNVFEELAYDVAYSCLGRMLKR